jgi:small conductance mechanosensitive channel
MDTANFGTTLVTWLSAAGIKILIALATLLVAFKIINTIAKKIDTANAKSGKLDPTTSKTITYILKIIGKVIVVLCLVSYLGIDTTAMSALIASLGVAAGFALNGTLSNLAGGILLLITRPFKVGDFVDLCGYTGTVEEIQIVYTKIATIDNRSISIPNGAASTNNIVNYTEKELRMVDLTFTVSRGPIIRRLWNV